MGSELDGVDVDIGICSAGGVSIFDIGICFVAGVGVFVFDMCDIPGIEPVPGMVSPGRAPGTATSITPSTPRSAVVP